MFTSVCDDNRNKEYKQVKYKEGYYESIVITIGDGKGDNWWCVLFPNLCLVDLENNEKIEYKSWVAEKLNKIFYGENDG